MPTVVKKPKKATSDLLERIQALQKSLSSSTDLNPLTDLLALAKAQSQLASPESAKAVHRCAHILVRCLTSLCQQDRVQLDNGVDAEGYLFPGGGSGKTDAEKAVADWIRERWNESVELLTALLGHEIQEIRATCLELLMEMQTAACSSLSRMAADKNGEGSQAAQAQWSLSPWRAIVLALLAGPPSLSHLGTGKSGTKKTQIRRDDVPEDVRQKMAENGMQEYDDIRFAVLREVSTTLRKPSPSAAKNASLRANTLSLLLLLTAIPAEEGDLNNFLVAELSMPLAGVKKGKKKAAGPKLTEDGDSEAEDEGMEDWFSDSDAEESKAHKPKALAKQSASGLGEAAKTASGSRRKKGPTFHEGLHQLSTQKGAFSMAWLDLLLPKRQTDEETGRSSVIGGELSLAATHEILVRLHGQILPHLSRPTLIHDFLVACLDSKGATALLALNSIFTLVTQYNLDYPQFYTRLYALLDSSVLHMRYRARFLRLLDVFLSSTHLSAVLVASFVKRLSRLSLRAPPAAIASVLPFIWNLLKRHPRCLSLIHKEWDGDRLNIGPAGVADPFDAEETDPLKTGALESSLWELASFGASTAANAPRAQVGSSERLAATAAEVGGEAHYLASITSLAKILAQPFTKERYDLEDFLDLTYGTMFETETAKTLKRKVPITPALAYSLPGGYGAGGLGEGGVVSRVDVFPTVEARIRAIQSRKVAEEQEAQQQEAERQERGHITDDDDEREAREAIEQLKREERAKKRKTEGTGEQDVCARLFNFG